MENTVYIIAEISLRLHTHRHTQSTMLTHSKYVVKKQLHTDVCKAYCAYILRIILKKKSTVPKAKCSVLANDIHILILW